MVVSTRLISAFRRMPLLMFFAVVHLSPIPCAAQRGISLEGRNVTKEWILARIQEATGCSLIYEAGLFEQVPRTDIYLANASRAQAFRECLAGLRMHTEMSGNTVFIKRDAGSALFTDLQGRVVDAQRQPLAGATVAVQGTAIQVQTDTAGIFHLPVSAFRTLVTISYAGFITRRDSFSNKYVADIMLEPTELDEVVNTPYQQTTQRNTTGTEYQVKAADIASSPVNNPLEALQGRVPGVTIREINGVPGSAVLVLIDGRHSIQQGNDPLYVIDGVPLATNGFLSAIGSGSAQGPHGASALNFIPLSAIASIGVMKDAAATALYGSRASNGVILITLKQGWAGRLSWTAAVNGGVTRVVRTSPLLNTSQFLQLRQEAILNDRLRVNDTTLPEQYRWVDPHRYTDFKKTTMGATGFIRDAHIDCGGGNTNTFFLLSGRYYQESTVFPDASYDQDVSFYGNLHHQSTNKRLRLGFSGLYNWEDTQLPIEDYSQFQWLAPNAPAFTDAAGKPQWGDPTIPVVNILAKANNTYWGKVYTIFGHAEGSYEFAPYFFAEARVGYNAILTREQSDLRAAGQPPYFLSTPADQTTAANNDYSSGILEALGKYIGPVGDGRLDAAIGITYQCQRTAYALRQEPAPGGVGPGPVVTQALVNNRYEAFFGRATYIFRKAWILSASLRRDGSSKFGPGWRYGDFGSVGAAWIFRQGSLRQDESDGHDGGWLSFGKIKGSYGTTGNDQIGPQLYDATTAPMIRNNLRWELNHRVEAGIDLRFFRNRFAFSANVYRNWTHDQIIFALANFRTRVPHFSNELANVLNEGLEFVWQVNDLRFGEFHWSSQLVLTIPRNILKSFPLLDSSPFSTSLTVGRSLTATKGYHLIGVDPSSGLYTFQGVSPGGMVAPGALVSSPSLDPKYYAGWSHELRYRHWELRVFVEWRRQNGYNPLAALDKQIPPGPEGSSQLSNGPVEWLRHWQKPGDHSMRQRLSSGADSLALTAGLEYTQSDGAVGGASYLRVKTVALSYQWKASPTKKNRPIEGMGFYLKGENLWTVSRFPVTDPETQNPIVLPPLRILTAGFSVSF